jgi:putative ABC transport system ATP-binding protein
VKTILPDAPVTHAPPPATNGSGREPLFSARGLTKIYPSGDNEIIALNGVDLDLFEGELIVLLGASGSGKSTLLNNLGGLDVPTSGTLTYRGRDLTSADENELTQFRRDSVGFVFQFYNLIPSLTGRENVALITEISRDPMTPEAALALVDLSDRMDHFPSQLSGGQQQRVAIARAIAKRPEVLLCDEPTGALDIKTGITVLEALERVNLELGTLTVVITHNAVIAEMADRVIHLSDGQFVDIRENATRRPVRSLAW